MTDIRVDHTAMGSMVAQMQETVRSMDRRLDHLETELRQARVEWTGDAAGAFERARSTWNQEFGDMRTLLGTLATKVDDAGVAYRAADSRGAALFD